MGTNLISFSGPPTGIRFTCHATERIRQCDIRQIDVATALGPRLVDDGELTSQRAGLAEVAMPLRPGTPLLIAKSYPAQGATADLLLGQSASGRRLRLVVKPETASVTVITLWSPDGLANQPFWHDHAMTPTKLGTRRLPPARWYLEDEQRGWSLTPCAA